jgi:UDP-2,3-diacylglucosamine pyrophosphatase LpxH
MTAVSPPTDETIAVVADLHLAAGDNDPFTEDGRFADTVAGLVAATAGHGFRLVLLGDSLDFPAVTLPDLPPTPATTPAEAVAKLRRILGAHPDVVEALRGVVRAGHRIDLVAGNHDMELLFPAVQEVLRVALGDGPGKVAVHPWLLLVPGVIYAEHGQQHHDFNRFPWLCSEPPPVTGRLAVPAGSYLDELTHLRARQPGESVPAMALRTGRMVVGLAGALGRLGQAERRRSERERRLVTAPPDGISARAVLAIDRAAAATPTSIARRAIRMASARWVRNADFPLPYMNAAARSVHATLDADGAAVPFYVFGHTHVAADLPIAGGAARYLNPGTWSCSTRRAPGGDHRCGVVLIETRGGRPQAELRVLS